MQMERNEMHTAELTFTRPRRGIDSDAAGEAVAELIRCLRRNGQLIDQDAPCVQLRNGRRLYVSLPDADSLQQKHHGKHVRAAVRALRKVGVEWSSSRILGWDPESDPTCTCRKPPSLILTTNFLSCESPLRCGGCSGVVPLYRVPPTSEHDDYDDVRWWDHYYRHFDAIWIDSGVGERMAYRQLSRHDSELTEEGRGICQRTEKATGIPTYYFLLRYYGRSSSSERCRRCPSCGGDWLLAEQWLNHYAFRCSQCRLVSNISYDV